MKAKNSKQLISNIKSFLLENSSIRESELKGLVSLLNENLVKKGDFVIVKTDQQNLTTKDYQGMEFKVLEVLDGFNGSSSIEVQANTGTIILYHNEYDITQL